MAMETMTRVNEQMDVAAKKPMAVQPGVARMRELTPAQRRAVMFAQQQVLKHRPPRRPRISVKPFVNVCGMRIRRRTSRLPPPSPWWLRRSLASFAAWCYRSCAARAAHARSPHVA